MDDLLVIKSIPLSKETILWFEFLLNPNLLQNHLQKPNPEPSCLDLLNQFLNMAPDVSTNLFDINHLPEPDSTNTIPVTPGGGASNGKFKMPRKQLAVKILGLKVATFLKWNLDVIEQQLIVPKQICLLKDLCIIAFGKNVNIPLHSDFVPNVSPEGSEKAAEFALTLYHRWVIRLQLIKDIALKNTSRPMIPNLMIAGDQMQQCYAIDIPVKPSVDYLVQVLQSTEQYFIFSFDTLTSPDQSSENFSQNFDNMRKVPSQEIRAQIHYDLANYYLFSNQYEKSKESIIECEKNFLELKNIYKNKSDYLYCHIDQDELNGYKEACGIRSPENPPSLLEQFHRSIMRNFEDLINILRKDNINRAIPFVNRRITELDIEGSISLGNQKYTRENFEFHIATLNFIRGLFEDDVFNNVNYFQKYRDIPTQRTIFLTYLKEVIPSCCLEDKQQLKKKLILTLRENSDPMSYIDGLGALGLFKDSEITELKKQFEKKEIPTPSLLLQTDWQYNSNHKRVEIGSLERQLISCTQPHQVRKLLVKLSQTVPNKELWTVNPSWEVHQSVKAVILSLNRGFMLDYALILFGKSREMMTKHNYAGAIGMLNSLKTEIQRPEMASPHHQKVGKLVNYEILFIELCQYFDEWKSKTNYQALGARCKQFVFNLHNTDLPPRIEIIELALILLLNINDLNSILMLDKRIASQVELPVSVAASLAEIEKSGKVSKKVHRDVWDLILNMFSTNNKSKPLGNNSNNRNSPILAVSRSLQPFLQRIRDIKVFNFMINLISKMHNILKDDVSSDMNIELAPIFPTLISDQMQYNSRSVSEILNWLLIEALNYYPQNLTWLKLKGDLELSLGNNESAMKYYVSALVIGTENCTIPPSKQVADDQTIKKMIKCTSNLGCFMQAVLLSQFLEEIDYAGAIKNISEKPANFMDAMDSYYHLLWDQTLLEFLVTILAKKGENTKKLEAISVMSNAEINPNNSDEIKREVINVRKARILRSLSKQYL